MCRNLWAQYGRCGSVPLVAQMLFPALVPLNVPLDFEALRLVTHRLVPLVAHRHQIRRSLVAHLVAHRFVPLVAQSESREKRHDQGHHDHGQQEHDHEQNSLDHQHPLVVADHMEKQPDQTQCADQQQGQ